MDKVQFLSRIKELSSQEQRRAELALFCHQPAQAEAAYLSAGLVYRAIDLHLSLFNWERYVTSSTLDITLEYVFGTHLMILKKFYYYTILYRALEIAVKHKTHVDTVLAFREVYLKEIGCSETLQQFQQYSGKVCLQYVSVYVVLLSHTLS